MFLASSQRPVFKVKNCNVLPVILVFFLLSESLTKILDYSGVEHYRVGIIFKLLFLLYVFLCRSLNKNLISIIGILTTLFFLSQLIINTPFSIETKIIKNLIYLGKYLFIIITADYIKNLNMDYLKIMKAVKVIMYFLRINFILIILGVIFDIDVFKTYAQNRFGFDGLIQMNSHASYIYGFALIYVLYNFLQTKKLTLDFWIVFISGILIGTKTLYLLYVLIGIYFIYYFKLHKKPVFYIITVLILSQILVFNTMLSQLFETFFLASFKIYHECGFWAAITSTRNVLLTQTLDLAFNYYWTIPNYFIGGSFFNVIRTEMAFVDLFLFWGIIGMTYYFWLYYKYIIVNFMSHPFLKFAIVSILICAFFGGNFFTNAVIAIHIIVFSNFFMLNTKNV